LGQRNLIFQPAEKHLYLDVPATTRRRGNSEACSTGRKLIWRKALPRSGLRAAALIKRKKLTLLSYFLRIERDRRSAHVQIGGAPYHWAAATVDGSAARVV
jgi:hypothetical protein